MNEEISIRDFEKWVYNNTALEEAMGSEAYIELASINFNNKYATDEVLSQADEFLDYAAFEQHKLMLLLQHLIQKNGDFESLLLATYQQYCWGYKFMIHLGIDYGLNFIEGWIPEAEKSNRINEIYPEVKRRAEQVINWLNSGAIVLTGKDYQYIDNRYLQAGQFI
ncbi:hypothetical protein [Chitinophaga sp.]|uniref:hypothetical protein n=1 Tax=Chitinophaga sp. TaxID=1869181 RepID=UPI002F94E372